MTPTDPAALPTRPSNDPIRIAGYDVELAGMSMVAGIAALATAVALAPGGV